MAQELEIFLKVSVENEEQARRVMECVCSGYAAEVVRMSALWGPFPFGGAGPNGPAPFSFDQSRKREEDSIVLERVEDRVGAAPGQPAALTTDKPRPKGIAGRKRMGRG